MFGSWGTDVVDAGSFVEQRHKPQTGRLFWEWVKQKVRGGSKVTEKNRANSVKSGSPVEAAWIEKFLPWVRHLFTPSVTHSVSRPLTSCWALGTQWGWGGGAKIHPAPPTPRPHPHQLGTPPQRWEVGEPDSQWGLSTLDLPPPRDPTGGSPALQILYHWHHL